jgi:hypothetical protein
LKALAAGLAAALLAFALAAQGAPAPALASAKALRERLLASGRADATVLRGTRDAVSQASRSLRARLTLQSPGRVRVEFPATREIIVLRGDGGEWLQPELSQLLRFGSESLAPALHWWRLLLPEGGAGFSEHELPRTAAGGRRFVVVARESASDSAWVTLGGDGLPRTLRYRDPSGDWVSLSFSNWQFRARRPDRDFRLVAPDGFETVSLP